VSVELLLLDFSKGLRALKRIPVTPPLTSMVSSASATLEVFSRLKYFESAGRNYVLYTLLHEAGCFTTYKDESALASARENAPAVHIEFERRN
jgi:hypothetical protein